MKKIFLSIFLAAIMLSCGNKTFSLEGQVHDLDLNGVTMVISIYDGTQWTVFSEVVVENNSFTLRGSVEQPKIARLMFNDRERQARGQKTFILENERIHFSINEEMKITMSGGRANNLLQDFENELAELHEMPEEFKAFIVNFSKNHVNTLPGTAVFMETSHVLSLEDRLAIINLMNAETKTNARIQTIAQRAEAEQKVAPGMHFTDFTLPNVAGNMVSLSDVVGQHDFVLLQFWASWCGPCIRSLPELKEFYASYNRQRLEIFSVSLDNDRAAWENAIATHQLSWIHVSDLAGWESAAGQLYAVSSIPTRLLIDRQGTILGRNLSISEMENLMK